MLSLSDPTHPLIALNNINSIMVLHPSQMAFLRKLTWSRYFIMSFGFCINIQLKFKFPNELAKFNLFSHFAAQHLIGDSL